MKVVVAASDDGRRLDQVIADRCGCSRAEANRWLDDGRARLRGKRARGGIRVVTGDEIDIEPPGDKRPIPEPRPLEILLEDRTLLALNKPAGIPTHPLKTGESGTLANAVVARFPECADASVDPREGGAAHRLDTGTSGAILFARDRSTWSALREAFRGGTVKKEYLALVIGHPHAQEIDAPLAHAGKRARVRDDGAPARTRIEVLAQGADVALVRAITSTGRMHQVRAHLAHVGHPLAGDTLYGAPAESHGHLLHAWRIELAHPSTHETLRIEAPLTADRAEEITRRTGWTTQPTRG